MEPRLKNPVTENSLSPLSATNVLWMTTYAPLTVVPLGLIQAPTLTGTEALIQISTLLNTGHIVLVFHNFWTSMSALLWVINTAFERARVVFLAWSHGLFHGTVLRGREVNASISSGSITQATIYDATYIFLFPENCLFLSVFQLCSVCVKNK